ncbi:MAG: LuxR C-terminal-related transcriptional regulator, partial [Fimbriimonas sp.]
MTPRSAVHAKLSARERQLLDLASRGFTDQGIAHELNISVPTVATYWGRIRIKMGPLSRPELVGHYVESESEVRLEQLRQENESLRARLEIPTGATDRAQPTLDSMRELIRFAPDAVLFIDQEGQILMGNEAAARLFGCQSEEFPH